MSETVGCRYEYDYEHLGWGHCGSPLERGDYCKVHWAVRVVEVTKTLKTRKEQVAYLEKELAELMKGDGG